MPIKFDPYDAEKSLFSAQSFAIYVTPDQEQEINDFTYRFIEAGAAHYRDACRGLELYTDLALY